MKSNWEELDIGMQEDREEEEEDGDVVAIMFFVFIFSTFRLPVFVPQIRRQC